MNDRTNWIRSNGDVYSWGGGIDEGRGTITELARAFGEAPASWLLDGFRVSIFTLQLPASRRKEALGAIAYLLEEQVASDIDTLDFAVLEEHPDGRCLVGVVDKLWYHEQLNRLREAGLKLVAVIPEPLALTPPGAGLIILPQQDRVFVRSADAGWVCEPQLLPTILQALPQDSAREIELLLSADYDLAASPIEPDPDWSVRELGGNTDSVLFELAHGGASSMLVSESGRAQEHTRNRWFAGAALIACLAAATLLVGLYLSNAKLQTSVDTVQARIEATFSATFPEVKRLVNPRLQAKTQLQKLKAGTRSGMNFLDVLAKVASHVKVAAADALEINRISFSGNALDLTVTASDILVLEAFQNAMSELNLQVRIVSAENKDGEMIGRLQLSEIAP